MIYEHYRRNNNKLGSCVSCDNFLGNADNVDVVTILLSRLHCIKQIWKGAAHRGVILSDVTML